MTDAASLTKWRFVSGARCLKLLWWQVHEPLAVELQPDKVLLDLFDQGRQVGELARALFPHAVLIPAGARSERLAATQDALAAGAGTLLEAAFHADHTFVAADILTRGDHGWELIEVKSASEVKDEHICDATIQAHVLSRNGAAPASVAIMHLNKEFRHPATGDLFSCTDVTDRVSQALPPVKEQLEEQLTALAGPLPRVPVGLHCFEPRDCVFHDRCWPKDDRHISTLYNVGPKKTVAYMHQGIHRIDNLPKDAKLPPAAQRQLRALATGTMVVEPTLARDLGPFAMEPIGFLDFETIARAVPVWDDMAPWGQAAAQFSYHESLPLGGYRHEAFLAEGPLDARPLIAQRLVDATAAARAVVTYSPFEKTQIRALQRAVPHLAVPLLELEHKLVDLLPVIRNNVYHPDFRGSFSIKSVLQPLVPDLSYNDLIIVNGLVASVEIARLLFVADRIPAEERSRVRQELLDYCERDTLAMVRLLEELRALATH